MLVKETLNSNINTALLNALKGSLKSIFEEPLQNLPEPYKTDTINKVDTIADKWAEAISDGVSQAVSDAVDTFVKTATVTIPLGVPVITFGTAATQSGNTTGPGIGTVS